MKRIGRIFDRMVTIETLELAYINARKGKRRSYGVRVFEKNKDGYYTVIQEI